MDLHSWFLRWVEAVSARPTPDALSYQTETGMMLWSALTGVVLGGIISALIQWLFSSLEYSRQQRAEKAERDRQERAIALRLNLKAKTIGDHLYTVIGLFLQCIDGSKDNAQMALCQRIVPVAGLPPQPVQFEVDEVSLALRAGDVELANKLLLLNAKSLSMDDILKVWNQERRNPPSGPGYTTYSGRVGIIEVSEDAGSSLVPYYIMLTDIARQMCEAIIEDFELTLNVLEEIGPMLKKHFNDPSYKTGELKDTARERLQDFKDQYEKYRDIGGIGLRKVIREGDTVREVLIDI